MEEGSALDRNVLIVILCLGLITIVKRQFNWFKTMKENPWVMLLVGYMLVSVLWSDMPLTSFKRWSREFIAVVMAFFIATEVDPPKSMQSIFRRSIYILIPFSYILIHYFPHYGRDYGRWSGALMWIGVASQKNGLVGFCIFAALFLIWILVRRLLGRDKPVAFYQTYIEVFLLILTIWIFMGPQHILTYSATSAVTFALGLIALIGLMWLKKQNRLISPNMLTVIIVIIIVYGTVTPFVGGGLFLSDASSILNRSETLTGRTEIWAYLVPYAMQKPILGHGFGGFWTDAMRAATSSHAHNGYLDIILNLGFTGHILFSMFLLYCCRKAQREMTRNFDWGVLWFCFILMAVIHNIAESSTISIASRSAAVLLFFDVGAGIYNPNTDVIDKNSG